MIETADLTFRLLRNLLYLLLALGGAALASWLVVLYYEHFPSYSSDGSAWGSLGDALSTAFAVLVFLLAALIWWSRRMIADVARFKSYAGFVAAQLLLLSIPWAVLGWLWYRFVAS